MLYDRPTDKLILGKTLWSPDALRNNVDVIPRGTSSFEMLCDDSLIKKTEAFKLKGQLKFNVLLNQVDVDGAARYINAEKSLENQKQLVLEYDAKTRLEQLTMEHLKSSKLMHPEVLNTTLATHVVVGIEYGGKVLLAFQNENSAKEDDNLLYGALKGAMSLLSKGINETSDTKVTALTKKVHCKVYSDFRITNTPSNYEEAMEFYKTLPTMTEKHEDGVPVNVFLCPLESLREKPLGSRMAVSDELLEKACVNLENLQALLVECKELAEKDNFPSAKSQLSLFVECLEKYKTFYERKVKEISDRSASAGNDNEFASFLEQQEASVFSRPKLDNWLCKIQERTKVFGGILKSLNGTPFLSSGEVKSLLCDTKIEHVVCLEFQTSSEDDVQLSSMQAFLKNCSRQESVETATSVDVALVRSLLKRFEVLRDGNQDNSVAKFVATEELVKDSSDTSCAFVRYYYEGKLMAKNLTPLEKGQNLQAKETTSSSVNLVWNGSLTHLNSIEEKVQYKTIPQGEWQTSQAVCNKRTATIDKLQSGTEYQFRVLGTNQIYLKEYHNEPLKVKTESDYRFVVWAILLLMAAIMLGAMLEKK